MNNTEDFQLKILDLAALDCPFCGAKQANLDCHKLKGVKVYLDTHWPNKKLWPHVACLECNSVSPSLSTWNKRTNK